MTQNYKKDNQKLITVQMKKKMKIKMRMMKNKKMTKKIHKLNILMNNKKLACSKCNHYKIINYLLNLNQY